MLTPQLDAAENEYRGGVWVRDSTAGIGTVTYVNAADHTFGGLGHGICDVETGELLPMLRGVVVDVEITGVEKGRKNDPGELRGQSVALSARTAGAEYRRRRVRQLR